MPSEKTGSCGFFSKQEESAPMFCVKWNGIFTFLQILLFLAL
ncbi:hypothetical protein AB434_3885 [Heyndrickxia coagulans]|nr:hypothetical protein AB434_3885 [Heyndrickxia coagulans]KYC64576.1 hypothetical protein B4100_2658 [Heyndrickxia coagulans]KYC92331.1 hypothetical protein B4096_2564 [Heyndrickxia coagulans]